MGIVQNALERFRIVGVCIMVFDMEVLLLHNDARKLEPLTECPNMLRAFERIHECLVLDVRHGHHGVPESAPGANADGRHNALIPLDQFFVRIF